ncbi:hypothetical protein D9M68_678490 [compost metagenome]
MSWLSWLWSTTGPIWVPAFSASSIVSPFIRSPIAATKRSWMPSVTMRRDDAVQRWPVEKKAELTAASTATDRSASSSTTKGFLPPISSWYLRLCSTEASATRLPVPVEPVKVMACTSGLSSIAWPTTEPLPITRFRTPFGRPARWRMSTMAQELPGTSSAGLKTMVLP